jgi:hypothetical protein
MHRTARCTRAYASRFDFPRARAWSFVTTNSRKLASKFFRAGSGVDDVEVEGRDDARVTASSTTASTTASTTVRSASSSTTSPTASSIATTPWRAGECIVDSSRAPLFGRRVRVAYVQYAKYRQTLYPYG